MAYGMRRAFVGSDGTVSIEKLCLSLSSCRKPKSQEGNKSFVPEQRESSSVSRDSYACERFIYLYICIVVSWLYNRHS